MAAILKNGGHFEKLRWLTGFSYKADSTEYVCQIWCFFPEVKYFTCYLPSYMWTVRERKERFKITQLPLYVYNNGVSYPRLDTLIYSRLSLNRTKISTNFKGFNTNGS